VTTWGAEVAATGAVVGATAAGELQLINIVTTNKTDIEIFRNLDIVSSSE
jgi:hypothetical protein